MKASELIERLEKLMEKHGDLELCMLQEGTVDSISYLSNDMVYFDDYVQYGCNPRFYLE